MSFKQLKSNPNRNNLTLSAANKQMSSSKNKPEIKRNLPDSLENWFGTVENRAYQRELNTQGRQEA